MDKIATENQNIEFKQSWKDEYLKWICAFANTDGGVLYIGVKDDGTVCGVSDCHKLTEDIPNKIRNSMGLICDIELISDNDKNYFKIGINKYPYPVRYHGKYYKRSVSTLQELNGIELDKMILSAQGKTWDSTPIPNVKINDLENDAIRLFKKKASDSARLDNESLNVSNETLLRNLRLYDNDYLIRAAVIAFHPDPEKWITGCYIKIAYFENEADILFQDEIHGPLILQVEKTMDLIYSKYMKALISYNDIYRKETFFFPRAAFRELLLNAVIHKDYMSTAPIQIRIYKDKIRLWNDGNLPKEVPVEKLYKEHISKPHNPNLANVFFKCGMVESWGRGFEKIAAYCNDENAKIPQIDLSLGGITARCFASDKYLELEDKKGLNEGLSIGDTIDNKVNTSSEKISNEGINEGLNRLLSLNESDRIVLSFIKKQRQTTSKELEEKTKLSHATIERIVKKLLKMSLIVRVGSKKTGHWEINEK